MAAQGCSFKSLLLCTFVGWGMSEPSWSLSLLFVSFFFTTLVDCIELFTVTDSLLS